MCPVIESISESREECRLFPVWFENLSPVVRCLPLDQCFSDYQQLQVRGNDGNLLCLLFHLLPLPPSFPPSFLHSPPLPFPPSLLRLLSPSLLQLLSLFLLPSLLPSLPPSLLPLLSLFFPPSVLPLLFSPLPPYRLPSLSSSLSPSLPPPVLPSLPLPPQRSWTHRAGSRVWVAGMTAEKMKPSGSN